MAAPSPTTSLPSRAATGFSTASAEDAVPDLDPTTVRMTISNKYKIITDMSIDRLLDFLASACKRGSMP